MYDFHPHGSSRAPLDFNLPRRTDTVADALAPDPSACDTVAASDIDAGALLTDAGLPGHAVRSIVSSLPASEV